MPKTPDPVALRKELVRLLHGLEFYRDWRIAEVQQARGTVTQEDLNQIVMPASSFLELFDSIKGARAGDILKEVRQWYAQTASDLSWLSSQGADEAAEVRTFLEGFRASLGFDFYAEAGFLKQIVHKALSAEKIASLEDYYALKELDTDLTQKVIDPEEMDAIRDMLAAYEARQKSG